MDKNLKPPAGLEDYCLASVDGKIFSKERVVNMKDGKKRKVRQIELSQKTMANGYKAVSFWIDGTRKTYLVHRLVALAFLEEVCGKKFLNHKNGNKADNRLENLEWCTQSENAIHAFRELNAKRGGLGKTGSLNKLSLPVIGSNPKTGESIRFDGLMEAQRSGFLAACISECLHGKQKTHKGMIWKTA